MLGKKEVGGIVDHLDASSIKTVIQRSPAGLFYNDYLLCYMFSDFGL